MDQLITNYLASITLGDPQTYKNINVFPLFSDTNHGPEYLTLKEAMESGTFFVTEVSEGGTVPELKVINKGDKAVGPKKIRHDSGRQWVLMVHLRSAGPPMEQ